MPQRWMPILGEFDTTGDPLVFKGRLMPTPSSDPMDPTGTTTVASVGILLSNQKLVNGKLRATVKFHEVTPFSVLEFIVNYDHQTKRMLTAGLGGSFSMFSIREWVPTQISQTQGGSWANHQLAGDRANFHANVPYDLAARIQGSTLTLEVNDVPVIVTTLPAALPQPGQIGLFATSQSLVEIAGFAAETERPKAFIVMQFSSPYNEVYSHIIKDVCEREEFQIETIRGDEIYSSGIIIKDVIDQITQCQVVIADISPDNPNVYFEVGYALALEKPIILLAQRRKSGEPLPFDLSAFRVLFYEDTIGGKPKLEEGLAKHLHEILT